MDEDKRLWKLSDGRDGLRGKLGLVLMGGAMLSKSLIQFSVDGQGCVPSLLFDLRPNCPGGNEDNGDLLQGGLCHMQYDTGLLQPEPCPHGRQVLNCTSTEDTQTLREN